MIKITQFFYIHWLVFPLVILAGLVGGLNTLFMAYAIVAIHELFHLFAALLLKERVGCFIVQPFGMTVRLSAKIIQNTKKEMAIAFAGPCANLLMLALCPLLKACYGENTISLLLFQFLNLATLFVNLLPCLPLDGGRMLKALLIGKIGYLSAVSIMKRLSRIVIFLLILLGIVLLIVTRMNISLLMAAGFLALHLSEEQRQNECVIMESILYNKEKLYRRGLMPSRSISVAESVRARDIFNKLSYDSYHMIFIVNQKGKLLRTVTEAQVVETILKKGWNSRIADVF